MLESVMPSAHKTHSGGFTRVDSADTGAAPHAKARPDFSLICSIDANRVVRCCGTLIVSLGARLVRTHAGVNHHPLSMEGKFVTQNVAVAVARLIVRPQRPAVEDQSAAGLEAAKTRRARPVMKVRTPDALRIGASRGGFAAPCGAMCCAVGQSRLQRKPSA